MARMCRQAPRQSAEGLDVQAPHAVLASRDHASPDPAEPDNDNIDEGGMIRPAARRDTKLRGRALRAVAAMPVPAGRILERAAIGRRFP